ncbi:hypothetical protein AB0I02_28160 [Streptomyces phaeochromogenes]
MEQVARETGASSGAVRTRLSRAHRILGERLAEADSALTSKGFAGHG